jgi:MFS family permease
MASARSTLYTVMLVSLLGTAGIALPYPVLSPFFLQPEQGNALTSYLDLHPKILLGILLALYPLGLLVGSSFIGALSDIFGRRRLLVITLLAAAACYGLTGLAVTLENYPLFALARLLTGLCEGNIAISRAIALDLHPTIDRARSMSLVFATTYAGWLVGPLAGGYLMPLGVDAVFYIAGLVTLVTALLARAAISAPQQKPASGAGLWQTLRKENSLVLLKLGPMRPLILYHLLYTLGLNTFYEFYPMWLVERFSFNSQDIAWATVVITVAMISGSVYLVTPINKRLGALGTVRVGSAILALALMLLPLAGYNTLYPAFVAVGILIAITNGVFPAHMSERFNEYGQGRVMGLLTTNFCAANVIAALLGSLIALAGSGWSLFCGGVLCALGALWLHTQGDFNHGK